MPTYEPFDWYATPRHYDIVFDGETAIEARFIEAALDRYRTGPARASRRLLEPACGSCRLLALLARRGWAMSGFDASGPMLDFARRRLAGRKGPPLAADLRHARFHDFPASMWKAGRFGGAFCLVSSFQYVGSEAEAREHLRRMADALLPGGIYLLALHLTDYTRRRELRERWVASRGGTEVVAAIRHGLPDRRRRAIPMRSRLTVTEGGTVRRFETNWEFRTFDRSEIRRLLASEPRFEHVATHDYWLEIDRPVPFDRDLHDCVLVLRRRGRG